MLREASGAGGAVSFVKLRAALYGEDAGSPSAYSALCCSAKRLEKGGLVERYRKGKRYQKGIRLTSQGWAQVRRLPPLDTLNLTYRVLELGKKTDDRTLLGLLTCINIELLRPDAERAGVLPAEYWRNFQQEYPNLIGAFLGLCKAKPLTMLLRAARPGPVMDLAAALGVSPGFLRELAQREVEGVDRPPRETTVTTPRGEVLFEEGLRGAHVRIMRKLSGQDCEAAIHLPPVLLLNVLEYTTKLVEEGRDDDITLLMLVVLAWLVVDRRRRHGTLTADQKGSECDFFESECERLLGVFSKKLPWPRFKARLLEVLDRLPELLEILPPL